MAVAAVLAGQIGFMDITAVVENTLNRYSAAAPETLDDVLLVDSEARETATALLENA